MRHVLGAIAVIGLLALGVTRADAELVLNGGFEIGTTNSNPGSLTDWSSSGSVGISNVLAANELDGHASAVFSANNDVLSQTLATTMGQSYTLSFIFGTRAGTSSGNSFVAIFGGQTVLTSHLSPPSPGTLITDSFTTTVTATGPSTVLEFDVSNSIGFYLLDDVSVTPSAAVPEPSSLAMVSIAMLTGLGGWARRRRRASA